MDLMAGVNHGGPVRLNASPVDDSYDHSRSTLRNFEDY